MGIRVEMIAEFHFNSHPSGVEDPFNRDSPAPADTDFETTSIHKYTDRQEQNLIPLLFTDN